MRYSALYKNDVVNGEGVRVTLFVSGCDHQCRGCYNKSTWNPDNGNDFTIETIEEILESLKPDHISGLTLTGGDPLYTGNISEILRLTSLIRYAFGNTKNIWMWTGYTLDELNDFEDRNNYLRRRILQNVDVLIDGKFVEELKDPSLAWRGSSNQIIHRLTNKV
ncbi:putative anaerobic ribonucleoside-triphosphate reductase-activating protein [Aeromonas phage LAh_9]|uniref:Anaerobic ribonucleoside-triphosphate reductase-activating protein n=3 Tax=Lahexavirus TaxID=2843411 RepID=A0A514A0W2_9CAUD|nr:anaerobic ribonucleotide reductase small subunit [Aeromonas phage LAh_6]YP_009847466.1 anaerobic ribonucleotide reductase small subunit [Aeromonas phage LAh_8]YP_009847566.1 anaerobic ribonucleotide reductase small subunit [Aeromonas phage LAh_9]QDH46538.1 putative anaerobic ribonucleoside-triphosphate reductase-activating protein [Aeromonas phage LAh_6]QDH46774.1 putative anaerobic ribonucleoside-triphosphate reductase-activating protein [Aeromonas phage LAh_8]QDH46918.1 putative anaerobic